MHFLALRKSIQKLGVVVGDGPGRRIINGRRGNRSGPNPLRSCGAARGVGGDLLGPSSLDSLRHVVIRAYGDRSSFNQFVAVRRIISTWVRPSAARNHRARAHQPDRIPDAASQKTNAITAYVTGGSVEGGWSSGNHDKQTTNDESLFIVGETSRTLWLGQSGKDFLLASGRSLAVLIAFRCLQAMDGCARLEALRQDDGLRLAGLLCCPKRCC